MLNKDKVVKNLKIEEDDIQKIEEDNDDLVDMKKLKKDFQNKQLHM